jgi:hypothetical protein
MMEKNFIGWANFLAPNIMGNSDRPHLGEELSHSFCSTDPVVARNFAKALFFSDNRADLKYNTIDALVLQCSEDMIAPLKVRRLSRSKFTSQCSESAESHRALSTYEPSRGSNRNVENVLIQIA